MIRKESEKTMSKRSYRAMHSNIFYVARDKDGKLKLYKTKPIRNKTCKGCWGGNDIDSVMMIDKELFTDLSWDDDPEEVCLCLNNERYHTVKVEELDRLYTRDWIYSDMKATLDTFEDRIQRYNSLPWYKRIFKKV